jgi:selenide,water dikinase
LAPGELNNVIGNLCNNNKNVIIGFNSNEDASVYKINDNLALIQSVDLITPLDDDPYIYGQIAAANSLSDIFAMGAEVATALNIVGFDGCNHPKEVLKEILKGAENKVKECGGEIVGGHTIETPEMLFGLSVSAIADPKTLYRNNTPKEGDLLILTKPLGMGILTTSLKADMLQKSTIKKISAILAQLNYKASLALRDFSVNACTDITGFGLAGHALEMANNKFSIEFEYDSIPILSEALEFASMGIIPEGTYNNMSYLKDKVEYKRSFDEDILFYDAQTSGGLLIAVEEKDANALVTRLKDLGYEYAQIIAEVKEFSSKSLALK